jgi:hypothetical protein
MIREIFDASCRYPESVFAYLKGVVENFRDLKLIQGQHLIEKITVAVAHYRLADAELAGGKHTDPTPSRRPEITVEALLELMEDAGDVAKTSLLSH